MTPNCPKNFSPTPEQARDLVARIGKSQRWIAERLGIGERHLRYLLNGTREVNGKTLPVLMTYLEQYALEALALAAETMAQE